MFGFFAFAPSNGALFSNSIENDMVIATTSSNNVYIGGLQSSNFLHIGSNITMTPYLFCEYGTICNAIFGTASVANFDIKVATIGSETADYSLIFNSRMCNSEVETQVVYTSAISNSRISNSTIEHLNVPYVGYIEALWASNVNVASNIAASGGFLETLWASNVNVESNIAAAEGFIETLWASNVNVASNIAAAEGFIGSLWVSNARVSNIAASGGFIGSLWAANVNVASNVAATDGFIETLWASNVNVASNVAAAKGFIETLWVSTVHASNVVIDAGSLETLWVSNARASNVAAGAGSIGSLWVSNAWASNVAASVGSMGTLWVSNASASNVAAGVGSMGTLWVSNAWASNVAAGVGSMGTLWVSNARASNVAAGALWVSNAIVSQSLTQPMPLSIQLSGVPVWTAGGSCNFYFALFPTSNIPCTWTCNNRLNILSNGLYNFNTVVKFQTGLDGQFFISKNQGSNTFIIVEDLVAITNVSSVTSWIHLNASCFLESNDYINWGFYSSNNTMPAADASKAQVVLLQSIAQ